MTLSCLELEGVKSSVIFVERRSRRVSLDALVSAVGGTEHSRFAVWLIYASNHVTTNPSIACI